MQDSQIPASPEGGSVKSRLLELLKVKRMSQSEFARHLGVSPTYIGAMRRSIPPERMKTVMELFPDLNRDWLLYGDGEMLIEEEDDMPDLRDGYVVPLLPVDAYAGNLQMWSQGVELRDCEKVVSPVPGVDFGIRVSGNSMEPEFFDGNVLFIKRINERAFIPWGHPMVIDTENGVLVKVINPVESDEPGRKGSKRYDDSMIEASSYNPAYRPIYIPTESIYGLYRIITSIRQYSTL